MSINVSVIKAFSSGDQVSLSLPYGSTVGSAGAQVGAPSGSVYRVNGAPATSETRLGEGDVVTISLGKAAAG